ncbi:MAG: glycosyltransferase family 2 protein, partial [Candidatus Omnitrophica bacterium]|nr:glycosyltransferase family 2 protein [Candidatus Omnitrophota bacterium]
DLNSGLRAFRRDLAMKYFHLFPDGFSFTTTITLASLCDGHRVEFIPIDYTKRSGKSKIRPLRDTFNFIVLIIRVAAYFDPLRVFLPASFFTGFISLTMLVYYFYKDGGVSDAGVLACMVTLLIFMMGILADLVVRRSRS